MTRISRRTLLAQALAARGASNTRHVVSMGIIPVAAFDAGGTYAAGALAAPLPLAMATALALVLVALTGAGLRTLGNGHVRTGPIDGPAAWLRRRLVALGFEPDRSSRRAVAVATLPRLPLRVPHTRADRPADAPDVASWGLLRGSPGLPSGVPFPSR